MPLLSVGIFLGAMFLATYIVVRRYRSRRLLLARVAELESLSEAGRVIVEAELDVEALCALIAAESGKVIDNSTLQIGLFAQSFYHIYYWCINGRPQPTPQSFDLRQGTGIVGWIRQSKEPLLIHDFEREMTRLPARPRYISDTPPRSGIFIPLISGEETLGVIAAQSDQPNRFTEEDLRRLMILANQAAAAIAHARLFEQAEKRAAQLELVGEIGREISRVQSQDEIFKQVVNLTASTFGFHLVTIFGVNGRMDGDDNAVTMQASSRPELMPRHMVIAPGEGLVGTAVVTRQTVISNDTRHDDRFVSRWQTIEESTHSEMAIPLLVDDELLGVLDVQSPQPGFFSSIEKMTLETLAAETSIAINKMQQLARQREQAWLTTAQLQVAEAIGHADSLDEMLTAVTRLTAMLMGVSFCAVLLWDEEAEAYECMTLYGGDAQSVRQLCPVRVPLGQWPMLDTVHSCQEPITTTRFPPWLYTAVGQLDPPLSQIIIQPLVTGLQMMGVMLVDDVTQPNHNGASFARRGELLQDIAGQTARALENAHLRAAQQEEAWVNTALFQVAAAVNSLIDLNEILSTIVRLIPLLVGVESAVILIWDNIRQLFYPGPSYGIGEMERGLLETLAVDHDEMQSIAPGLLTHTEIATGDFKTIGLPHWLERVFRTSSACAFPLAARGELVGLMLVGAQPQLPHRRLNILTGIAHQAATAVVNHQLYHEAAERARLERELDVAREIQASLIPRGNPAISGCHVAGYWQAARQVSGDFYDFMELADGKWGILIADVADKGVPAAIFMALSRTILRTIAFNRTDPANTLIRANEIIDKDAQSDLFVTVFYAVWDPHKEILTYANAGHNPPLLLRADGQVQMLTTNGIALGVLPRVQIERRETVFRQGDTLILYTDGVTEAMNEDFDEFGLDRLRVTVEAARQRQPGEIVTAVTQAIHVHAGDTPQFDDITLVVMKR
ncbi:MAG TPA: SpoIIE family protein phosphatase [Chloroflexota bacterium]|nr:SpoIIE family protein phosphatase [Chloroflexota bacterium]